MTIARRLTTLLAVPLLVLVGIGFFITIQLADIAAKSRFVAESKVPSLAAIGMVSRCTDGMRVNVRTYLLIEDKAHPERINHAAYFRNNKEVMSQLLERDGDTLISGEKDHRLYTEFKTTSAEWTAKAEEMMSAVDAGRRKEAINTLISDSVSQMDIRLRQVSKEWIAHNEALAAAANKSNMGAIEEAQRNLLGAAIIAWLLTGGLGYPRSGGSFIRSRRCRPRSSSLPRVITQNRFPSRRPAMKPERWRAPSTFSSRARLEWRNNAGSSSTLPRWAVSCRGATSVSEFGQRLLSGLVPVLGGGVAALCVMTTKEQRLGESRATGSPEKRPLGTRFKWVRGWLPMCARIYLDSTYDLPPDYLRITSGVGSGTPAGSYRVAANVSRRPPRSY